MCRCSAALGIFSLLSSASSRGGIDIFSEPEGLWRVGGFRVSDAGSLIGFAAVVGACVRLPDALKRRLSIRSLPLWLTVAAREAPEAASWRALGGVRGGGFSLADNFRLCRASGGLGLGSAPPTHRRDTGSECERR